MVPSVGLEKLAPWHDTQVAMAVPLYLLYEICVWIAWFWERKKRREGQIIES